MEKIFLKKRGRLPLSEYIVLLQDIDSIGFTVFYAAMSHLAALLLFDVLLWVMISKVCCLLVLQISCCILYVKQLPLLRALVLNHISGDSIHEELDF